MKQWQREANPHNDNFAKHAARDAKSACGFDIGNCQDCRKRLCRRYIYNSHIDAHHRART